MVLPGFELLKQGAEGRLFKGNYLNRPTIIKERFVKKYRHPDLDSQLTKERIRNECRAILRCKIAGIKTPTVYLVDFNRRMIFMEYLDKSITVKDYISHNPFANSLDILSLRIGEILGKMHSNNIIHGDLTTSNMLLINKNSQSVYDKIDDLDLVLIDFGLAHIESNSEDKGVDLYVLERALISTHSVANRVFEKILEGYRKQYKNGAKDVLHKFEQVRARGRKRTMVG